MVVVREFGPVFCISVVFVKGIMKLTLGCYLYLLSVLFGGSGPDYFKQGISKDGDCDITLTTSIVST